jgi:hypothetical protein
VTPGGQEIVAPLPPEVTGQFGPGVVRFILMQHWTGHGRAPPRPAEGRGSETFQGPARDAPDHKDTFHTEKDALLEAGLESATWITVDDTATPGTRNIPRTSAMTALLGLPPGPAKAASTSSTSCVRVTPIT